MTTGHEWNGITELNRPVPRLVWLFLVATVIFSVVYWVLMPAWPLGVTYTRGLLGALPRLDAVQGMRLAAIPGTLPDPEALPPGCAFGDRCPLAMAECRSAEPPLDRLAATHLVRCIRAGEAA